MKRLIIVIGVCILAIVLHFRAADAIRDQARDFDSLDAYVQEQMDRSSIPGLSYAVIRAGEIVHMNGFGTAAGDGRQMTPQTPLYIGSVGKTFTALAIRQLVDAGKLELNAPVTRYLPDFRLAEQGLSSQITILDLVEHTSGFGEQAGNDPAFYDPQSTTQDLIRRLESYRLDSTVGESFAYSNINYILLGAVIEVVSGLKYPVYVQEKIFDPLGMDNSYTEEGAAIAGGLSAGYRYFFGAPAAVELDEPQGAIAAGFLISSTEDMARYLIAFTEHGRVGEISVVNPDGKPQPEDQSRTYNIHWLDQDEVKRPSNTETHSGGWLNYSAGIAFMPGERVGVVVLANSFPAQWLPVKDGFAIALDVLRLYTGNLNSPPTIPLTSLYLVVDFIFLAIAGFVMIRALTLRNWKHHLERMDRRTRAWLPSILIDFCFPLFVLIGFPGIILASTGNFNPLWGWNRLTFQVPDVAAAMLVLFTVWFGIGCVKAWIFLALTRSYRSHEVMQNQVLESIEHQ